MVDEFLSLLENEKEKTYEVLRPQIHPDILKYLTGGFFDKSQKRLIAFALMPVNKDYFWKYDYLLDFSGGHSSILFGLPPEEIPPTGIYGLPSKSLKEYIEEGFYHYNLVSFYSEYDFDEWNILRSCCFTNTKNREKIFESELRKVQGDIKDHFFGRSIFEETLKHHDDFNSRRERIRKQQPNEFYPVREFEMKIPTHSKPYIGHSHLIDLIRTKKKREVNQAYITYNQIAVFEPLCIKLKTFYPNEYHRIDPFEFYPCSMFFPEHRRYCMFICLAIDIAKNKRLQFFLYLQENDSIYEWTYFPPPTYKKYRVNLFNLSDLFKPISQLDSQDYFINPECTLDDDEFWNNYVLKKEDGRYAYLKEIKFNH